MSIIGSWITYNMGMATAWQEVVQSWCQPGRLWEAQQAWQAAWCEAVWAGWQGNMPPPRQDTILSDPDPRWADPLWQIHPVYASLRAGYELMSSWHVEQLLHTPGCDPDAALKVAFWVRCMWSMCHPAHGFWTYPRAMVRCWDTQGMSVWQGVQQWWQDAMRGDISLVDPTPFQLGVHVASTPGQVIKRHALFELLQYTPQTERVHATPVLMVPPWINKFYVLDLSPQKSMIRFLLQQGIQVFLMSWRNPEPEDRHWGFEDYVAAIHEACAAVCQVGGVRKVHPVGYCVGGTALSVYMGWLAQQAAAYQVPHWTLLCSLQDFAEPGLLRVFCDPMGVRSAQACMQSQGVLKGADLGWVFRMLRVNSLIGSCVSRQYVCGEAPVALDVLYWNTDPTHLPERMHSEYLEQLYGHNQLVSPEGMQLGSTRVKLRDITSPLYAMGTLRDHITPWRSTFQGFRHMACDVRYTLASSGHIAGVLSPPGGSSKRAHWSGSVTHDNPDDWWSHQTRQAGSWWLDWMEWLKPQLGRMQRAPAHLGHPAHPALEKAPGSYVRKRCEDSP